MSQQLTDFIARYREQVDEKMLSVINSQTPASLYDPMRYAITAGGKHLRPALLSLSFRALGGGERDVLAAASALEMVHDFTLVHDDIMDHDDLRRGRETVHKKWDDSVAILAGDALLVYAYQLLSQIDPSLLSVCLDRFSRGIIAVCEGQALDKEYEQRSSVLLSEYHEMILYKTGKLFGLACELGAILAKAPEGLCHSMRDFGEQLGIAFQIQDDLLDLTSSAEKLGKDIGSDLIERKKTFLWIHFQENSTTAQKQRLEKLISGKLGLAEIENAITLMNETGTLTAAHEAIGVSMKRAHKVLDVLANTPEKLFLIEILSWIEERDQ